MKKASQKSKQRKKPLLRVKRRQTEYFYPDDPDEHREHWELVGRRVAMHLETRNFTMARAVIDEAEKFAVEKDREELEPVEGRPLVSVLPIQFAAILENGGILTVRDLLMTNRDILLSLPNVGHQTLCAIGFKLRKLGYTVPESFFSRRP